MMTFFSIILPCYNCEKYLLKCLESIAAQTYKNFEIILVNDGSTDGSLMLMEEYKKKNTNINIKIINQDNMGGIITRSNGVKAANGEYVLLLDSDDWVEANLLETINKYILKYDRPDIIKYRYQNEPSGQKSEKYVKSEKNEELYHGKKLEKIWNTLLLSDKYNSIWSCAFKRRLFDLNDSIYKRIVRKGEDLQINLQILQKANTVLLVDDILYHYWKNPNGITQNVNKEKFIRNCEDRLYLTEAKIKLARSKLQNNKNNDKIINEEYAHVLISQTIKLLSTNNIQRKDLVLIQNELNKTDIINYVKNNKIKYANSNLAINAVLNNILDNLKNGQFAKNYKYKLFIKVLYFGKKK